MDEAEIYESSNGEQVVRINGIDFYCCDFTVTEKIVEELCRFSRSREAIDMEYTVFFSGKKMIVY